MRSETKVKVCYCKIVRCNQQVCKFRKLLAVECEVMAITFGHLTMNACAIEQERACVYTESMRTPKCEKGRPDEVINRRDADVRHFFFTQKKKKVTLK